MTSASLRIHSLVFLAVLTVAAPVLAETELVVDGLTRAVVVAGDSANAKTVAQSLIKLIERVSGARLPLVAEASADLATIAVGDGAVTRGLGIDVTQLKPGGFFMQTRGKVLVLAGNDSNPIDTSGTAHAVTAFAEQALGVRYLWPGELGLVLPKQKTVRVADLDVRSEPVIVQRKIRAYYHNDRIQSGLDYLGLKLEDLKPGYAAAERTKYNSGGVDDWFQFHKLGGDAGLHAGHAFGYTWDKYHESHPEWFALQPNGSRDLTNLTPERARLCKSNLELIDALARDKIAELIANGGEGVSLVLNDGAYATFCQCDKCKALDEPRGRPIVLFDRSVNPPREFPFVSLTDRHVWFWNRLAEQITAKHPNARLGVYAYSLYKAPPLREKLHPNLTVGFVGVTYLSDAARNDARGDWIAWSQAATRLFWRPNILLMGYRHGLPVVFAHKMADDVRLFAEHGLVATDIASCTHSWATEGLNYYVLAKLLWNPEQDVDALIDDYCRAGFGPAASSIRRYFDRIENMTNTIAKSLPATATTKDLDLPGQYTPTFTAELTAILDEAAKQAADDETILRRIAFLRTGIDFARLQYATHELARDRGPGTPTALDREKLMALQQNKWSFMRKSTLEQPLAINMGCVAWGTEDRFTALGFRGSKIAPTRPDADEDGRAK